MNVSWTRPRAAHAASAATVRGGPRQLSRKHLRFPRSQPRLSIASVNTRTASPQPAAERRGHRPPSSLQRRSAGIIRDRLKRIQPGILARRARLMAAPTRSAFRASASRPRSRWRAGVVILRPSGQESGPDGQSQGPDNRASPQLIAPYRQFRGVGRVGIEPTTGGL